MFFVLFFFWGKKPIKVQTKGVVNNSSQFNTSCFFFNKKIQFIWYDGTISEILCKKLLL